MITLIFFRTFVPDMKKEIRKISGIWDFIGRYKYYFVVSIVVLVVGFLDENSVLHRHQRNLVIQDLKQEIENYRKRYEKDTRDLNGLSDAKSLEKFAREKYFMKQDNEDIYVLSIDRELEERQHEGVE